MFKEFKKIFWILALMVLVASCSKDSEMFAPCSEDAKIQKMTTFEGVENDGDSDNDGINDDADSDNDDINDDDDTEDDDDSDNDEINDDDDTEDDDDSDDDDINDDDDKENDSRAFKGDNL